MKRVHRIPAAEKQRTEQFSASHFT